MHVDLPSPDEAGPIADLLRASIRALCKADHRDDPALLDPWLANKTPAIVRRWIEGGSLRIVRVGPAIAAVGSTDGGSRVTLNYVAPDYRFQGASRMMIGALEDVIRATGADQAWLMSTATAHRFYLSCGWRDAGPPVDDGGMPGFPMVCTLAS